MSIINNYTFIVPACSYPLAEISITLINYFYPNIKILMSFDKKPLTNQRRDFFSKVKNLEIVPDIFLLGHARQLNRMINNHVKTKYFIAMDDDCFMTGLGILELIDNSIGEKDGAIDLYSCDPPGKLAQRALPYFCVFKTEVFKKYKMTFEAIHLYPEHQFYYDVGSFVLFDILKYKIPVILLNNISSHYLQHIWYISGLYGHLKKESFKNNDFNTIPKLDKDDFDLSNLSVEHFDDFTSTQEFKKHILMMITQINHYSQISKKILSENLLYPNNYRSLFAIDDIFKEKNKINIYQKMTRNNIDDLNWKKCNIGWLVSSATKPTRSITTRSITTRSITTRSITTRPITKSTITKFKSLI